MTERIEVGEAVIPIVADISKLKSGLEEAKQGVSTFKIAAGSALGTGFTDMVKGAGQALWAFAQGGRRDLEQMDRSLQQIERNARRFGNTTMDVRGEVERYATMIQTTTRFQDQEVVDSLNTMIRYTRDLHQAQYLLNIAQDVSVSTGMSLQSVSMMLGRAAQGNSRALMMLGRQLGYTGETAKDASKMLAQLEKDFKGAAQAEDNAAMVTKRFGDEVGELAEDLARKLKPAWDNTLKTLTLLAQMARGALGDELSSVNAEIARTQNLVRTIQQEAGYYKGRQRDLPGLEKQLAKLEQRRKELLGTTSKEADEQERAARAVRNKLAAEKELADLKDQEARDLQRSESFLDRMVQKEKDRAEGQKLLMEEEERQAQELENTLRQVGSTMANVQATEMQAFFTGLKDGTTQAQDALANLGKAFLKGTVAALGDVLIQKGAVYNFEALAALISIVNAAAAPGLFAAGAFLTGAGGGMKALAAGLKDGGVTIAGSTTTDTIPAMLRKNEAVVPLDDPRARRKLGGLGGVSVGSFQVVLPNVRDSSGFQSQSTALSLVKQLDRVQRRQGRSFAAA